MSEQNEKNLNRHRMTKDEKKFNFLDLQAYKSEDTGLYSMLPGWSPQIGGLTNNQKKQYFLEQRALAQANKSTDFSPSQEKSPSEFTKISKGVMTMAGVNPAGKRPLYPAASVDNQQYQALTDKNAGGKKIDFGKLYGNENSGASTFPNRQEQNQNIFQNKKPYGTPQYSGHNPIINPIPNNIQFKTQQFGGNQSQLNNNSNIFQNAGTNLIGGQ